ncbi:MAG: marine proteobacterial sortase target protein [Methyloceanibacter sp.]
MRRQALRSIEPLATSLFYSLILIFFFTLPSLLAKAEPFSPGTSEPTRVNPGDMNSGALLLPTEDGGFVQAPRLGTDVVMTVNGTIARVTVTQRFENPSERWLEGIYVFPLPEQSAVDALRMEIGSRVIEGEIKGRDDAKRAYEAAKDAGQKASLVEQERPNIFTNSVANIGPHEAIVVRIEYQETVKQDAGVYSLRFPLVVAPRYNPKGSEVTPVDYGGKPLPSDPVPDRDRISPPVLDLAKAPKINPVSIQVKLDAGFALGYITRSYHEIALKRTGDDMATLTLAQGSVPADKDFELLWKPKPAAAPQTSLFYESVGGQDYLLATVTPPTLDAAPKLLPRELIFVIDNSGSMAGTSIVQAKQSLLFALGRLRPGDKFNVVRFDDTMETLFDTAVDASSDNLAIAKHFVSRLDAEGGTDMLPALKAALQDATPDDATRLRQVVFLTDGSVGNEAQLFEEIASNRGRSRLFTVGIGSAPNSFFMTRAAELGRGTFTHIGSHAQVLERMSALFAKLEKSVMMRLKAEWPAGTSVEAWPNPLPDLYAGAPVVLSAKLPARQGELHLSGVFDGKAWTATLKLEDAVPGAGVAKLWARSKIASLEAKAYTDANPSGIDKAIETVALAHHLVSSQTSLIAIDKTKSRPDGQNVSSVDMPVNLPDGWVYDKVFAPQGNTQHAMKAGARPLAYNRSAGGSFLDALPSAMPQFAYDGGTDAAQESAPQAIDAAPAVPIPTQMPDTSMVPTEVLPNTDISQPQATQPSQPDIVLVPRVTATEPLRQAMLFILLLTFFSAATFIAWRYHRREFASPRRIGRRI